MNLFTRKREKNKKFAETLEKEHLLTYLTENGLQKIELSVSIVDNLSWKLFFIAHCYASSRKIYQNLCCKGSKQI